MPELWAITAYFNPVGCRSRRRNHRCFRQHLAAPLLTVEWSVDGRFELGPDDADLLLQVRGGDLMWQKERLLGMAIRRLPPEATMVAWLDCDVVLPDPRWPEKTAALLEEASAVQLFSEALYLDHGATNAFVDGAADFVPERVVASSARMFAQVGRSGLIQFHLGRPPGQGEAPRWPFHNPGMAWAARRSLLESVGLFERGVVGGADLFWLMAVIGGAEEWLAVMRDRGFRYLAGSSYRAWSASAHEAAEGRLAFVDAPLLHLDHGRLQDRQYGVRDAAFDRLEIDIDRDLVENESGGPWSFARRADEARAFMRRYFESRNEDRGFSATASGAAP